MHRVIQFNQPGGLKPYICVNTKLRTEVKDFLKLMNDAMFGKAMQNLREHRDIKLVTTEPN